jgi:hypothetical protein
VACPPWLVPQFVREAGFPAGGHQKRTAVNHHCEIVLDNASRELLVPR